MDFLQQFGAAVPEACCTEGTLILTQMEVLNLVSGYGLLSKPFDPTREHPGYNSSVHPPKSSCQDKPLNDSKLLVNQPHRYPPLVILTVQAVQASHKTIGTARENNTVNTDPSALLSFNLVPIKTHNG